MGIRERANTLSSGLARSPETVDRVLLIACAVVWLLVLGFSVAAGVALADLGRGHPASSAGDGSTPWLLYTVIGVSALVIALAIPLLLRARNAAPAAGSGATVQRAAGYPVPKPAQPAASIAPAALDRLLVRCGLGVLTAMGVALIAVAIATHLMAVGSNGASWALYGVAGAVTVAMVAIPILLLRQLQAEGA